MRISDHDHEVIMEEARRRDLLEHDELEQLEEDEEAESEVEADSDMDGAGDSEPESGLPILGMLTVAHGRESCPEHRKVSTVIMDSVTPTTTFSAQFVVNGLW